MDESRRRRLRIESGASTVEFAIVLALLLLIVFGTIQFGIVFNRLQGLEAAAREGARLASVGASLEEVRSRVHQSQSLFNPSDVLVETSPRADPPCQQVSDLVTVRVEVLPSSQYAVSIPLLGDYQIHYTAAGHFRCERRGTPG